jgi:PKD repeat protein
MNGQINVIQAAENQPPTANFSFNCTNLNCEFTDQSSDSDGTVASWSWNFDDSGSSSARNPVHSFAAPGTYSVSLTVTDNDDAQDSISRDVTVNEPLPDPLVINSGMTDAWYDPATDGQGMLIMVWDSIRFVFMAWFTFDTERPPQDVTAILGEPGHRWLTASGPFEGDTAILNLYLTAGGVFDAAQPPAITDQAPIGTATIKWTDCNAGILSYDIPSLSLSGNIPIQRIVSENISICEAGQ